MGLLIGTKNITVPENYVKKFFKANKTFLHQSVFDTKNKVEVPLVKYPDCSGIHNKEDFRLYPKLLHFL
jgi:hypothetical protein